MFDLRHLEHSTIIYEEPDNNPLVRLAWNKKDSNYLAAFAMHGTSLLLLDIRVPCKPVAQLSSSSQKFNLGNAPNQKANACVNGVAWAPHSQLHVCTGKKQVKSFYDYKIINLFNFLQPEKTDKH